MSVPSKDTLGGLLWAPCVSPSKGPSTLYVCSGKSFACELHSRREWLQLRIPCVETDTNTFSKIHLGLVFSLEARMWYGKNGSTALIWRRWLCDDANIRMRQGAEIHPSHKRQSAEKLTKHLQESLKTFAASVGKSHSCMRWPRELMSYLPIKSYQSFKIDALPPASYRSSCNILLKL